MKTTNLLLGAALVFSLGFAGLSVNNDAHATNYNDHRDGRSSREKRNESTHKQKDYHRSDRKNDRDDNRDKTKHEDRNNKRFKKDHKGAYNHDKRDDHSKNRTKCDHKKDDRNERKHHENGRSGRDDKFEKYKKSHKFSLCHATKTAKNWKEDGKRHLQDKCKSVTVAGDNDEVVDSGNTNVTPDQDKPPVVNILDEAASTDTPALAPGKGGVADQLPSTGPDAKGIVVLVAGLLTAAATYGGMYIRRTLF